MVKGTDLPAISGEKVYKCQMVILGMFLVWLSQLGPFFGVFFGTKGKDGEWPHAWWSLCFVGNAFASFGWYGAAQTYKLIRTSTELICKNMFGGTIARFPLESIESLETVSGKCAKYISVTVTDQFYEEMRAKEGCCKCCVSKINFIPVSSSGQKAFIQDNGLSGDGTEVPA
mmetsp:Transcript_6405/g.14583  ORF Transcript_6405/g.14583 Transcript_6405/m.14583 type:complete len:172 (-) Transcript_6405:221-736(-)